MKKRLTLCFAALSLSLLSACTVDVAGKKVVDTGGGKSEELSYELSENGCETKKHSFSSHESYCDGLKNDELNNFCATNLRYQTFKRDCSDRSWQ